MDDALEFVNEHPEIRRARLIWTWNFDAEIYDKETETTRTYKGDEVDPEYSFIGDREALLRFLAAYDCWNGFEEDWEGSIKDGVLDYENHEYRFDSERCPCRSMPDNAFFVEEKIGELDWVTVKDEPPDGFVWYGVRNDCSHL